MSKNKKKKRNNPKPNTEKTMEEQLTEEAVKMIEKRNAGLKNIEDGWNELQTILAQRNLTLDAEITIGGSSGMTTKISLIPKGE